MIHTKDPEMIKRIIPILKSATTLGKSNDGCHILVYYNAYVPTKTQRQIDEAQAAKNHQLDLHTHCGPLESYNLKTKTTDSFIFTILSLTRVKSDKFKYRTFNVDLGEVVEFYAFPDFGTAIKVHAIQAIEIPASWLRKAWNRLKGVLYGSTRHPKP